MDNNHLTRRSTLCALGGAVGSILVTGTAVGQQGTEASITFNDQQVSRGTNQTVVVESVTLPEPGGYIDIHDPNDTEEMPLGQIKGARDEYLEPGTHRQVEVKLFKDFNCYEFEQDRLEESKELMAMPHKDDPADQEFTHFCKHGGDGVEDGGFGEFPDVVQDTACIQVAGDAASLTSQSPFDFFGMQNRLGVIR